MRFSGKENYTHIGMSVAHLSVIARETLEVIRSIEVGKGPESKCLE